MLKAPSTRAAARLACYYFLFGLCWILFSDLTLNWLVTDPALNAWCQTLKGWFYVGFTTVLLLFWSKNAFSRINHLREQDSLTGVKNRSWALQFGTQLVLGQKDFHLILLDLDNFKELNNAEGHQYGDAVLAHVAHKIANYVPEGADIARMAGDEFAIFDYTSTQSEIQAYLKALFAAFTSDESDSWPQLTACVGISSCSCKVSDFKKLLKQSLLALQHAKILGQKSIVVYQNGLEQEISDAYALTQKLRKAVTQNSFQIHFQPQINLHTGELTGVEALARWNLEGKAISPAIFIPLAERSGLITELTDCIINKALTELSNAELLGSAIPNLSLNLSPVQFNSLSGVDSLLNSLEKHADFLPYLTLEMTESAIMKNLKDAASVLQQLVLKGVKISIDDFGTGYSSFGLLKKLPIHELKIDRSLIQDICQNPSDEVIVNAVIAMAHTMKFSLVAEGVEEHAQDRLLKQLGCDVAQGYLYGKPMPLKELVAFIHQPAIAVGLN